MKRVAHQANANASAQAPCVHAQPQQVVVAAPAKPAENRYALGRPLNEGSFLAG
jgi:hypothetical protein